MEPIAAAPIPAIPNLVDSSNPIIGWFNEAIQESEAFLTAQPGYHQIAQSISTIMSQDDNDPFDPKAILSQTRTNRVAKITEDIVAMMTSTKPFWDYQVSNRRFEQQASIYGKLATHWYSRRSIDMKLASCIQYYAAGGTGYIHMYWNTETQDIDCEAIDPRNVLPIRPVAYDSLESCLGVVIKRQVPVNYLKDRYGVEVSSESDGSLITWLSKAKDSASSIVSPIWRWYNTNQNSSPALPRIPVATLYQAYIKDDRSNTREDMGAEYTGETILMGQWSKDGSTALNNWSYKVQVGEPLYPHRRMIMWCGNTLIYDGPSYYWHGQFPIMKLTLNPQPWSWLGKAPIWDLLRLQNSLNRTLRVIDDHLAQVAQPGAIMDKNNVSRSTYDSFDTRRAGWKAYQNPLAGKGISIQNPPPLPPEVFNHRDWVINEMAELSGLTDLRNLMQLGQMPSVSSIETIIHQMTPGLQLRSRILEAFTRDFAMQLAYNFSEFYTMPMRVAIMGPGSITLDDFDFDPGSLVPDFVHKGDIDPITGRISADALIRGPRSKYDRAQEFLRMFIFKVSPGSLLNAAQVEQRMIYLQLARAGWMDIFTLWETFGIPNIGVLPDNVRTIPERIQYQNSIGLSGEISPAGRKASGQAIPRGVVKET
jgi:hypothetical protein